MLVAFYLIHAASAFDLTAPLRSLSVGSTFSFPARGVASLTKLEGEANAEIFTTHLTFEFQDGSQEKLTFEKGLSPDAPIQELTYGEMLDARTLTFDPIEVNFDPIPAKNGIFDLSLEHIFQRLALELRQPITLTRKDGFLSLPLGICTLFERAPSKIETRTIPAGHIVFTSIDLYYLKTAEIQTPPVLTLYQDESTNVGLRCQPKVGWSLLETLEDLIDSTASESPVEWSLGRKHAES